MASKLGFAAIIPIAICTAVQLPSAWAAAEQIGLAVEVRNDVAQVEPKTLKILKGDDVVRDEVVRTHSDSDAKFVLRDDTNLILGPNSSLRLDRAVFSDEKSVGDIAVKLSTGAFRFVTGKSSKESYVIKSPLATIGVRGTILDFKIERLRNTVVLKEGGASVCAGGKCVSLSKYGDAAVIKSVNGQIEISLDASSDWSFDDACHGTLCSQTTFAAAEDSMTTGSIGAAGSGGNSGASGGSGGGPIGSSVTSRATFSGADTPSDGRSTADVGEGSSQNNNYQAMFTVGAASSAISSPVSPTRF